jgi:recombination protein RecA
MVKRDNRLSVFTNQIRQGESAWGKKEVTPGGEALPFYSSLRLRIGQIGQIKKEVRKDVKKAIGVKSSLYVKKSSIDIPYRDSVFSIIFNYGVDDLRDNIQWLRKFTSLIGKGTELYKWEGEKQGKGILSFIAFVEDNNMEEELRAVVIKEWKELEAKAVEPRKPKVRH